jgi:hypothetical protein
MHQPAFLWFSISAYVQLNNAAVEAGPLRNCRYIDRSYGASILMFNPGEERRQIREIERVKMRGKVPPQSKFRSQSVKNKLTRY